MSQMDAWSKVIELWNTPVWTPLPSDVRESLHFDSRIGVCSGMLVSKAGASGIHEFIHRINAKKK